jgi:AcrR family transcriptional regulator
VTGTDPPDLHHWRLPRGRHGLPRELIEQSQRERLLWAVVHVTAEKGYEATTVADILEVAGVGRESFYELFKDKRDCFLAAHDLLVEDLLTKTTEAYRRPDEWPEQVRRGLLALLEWLAADPNVARVTMIELAAVGPTSQQRFRNNFHRFIELLDEGRPHTPASNLPNISAIALGAAFARIYEEIAVGRAAGLPRLYPRLTFDLLLPFLGEHAAREQQGHAIEETTRKGVPIGS